MAHYGRRNNQPSKREADEPEPVDQLGNQFDVGQENQGARMTVWHIFVISFLLTVGAFALYAVIHDVWVSGH